MVASGGWCFTSGFPLKLHREFLFRDIRGHSARVVLYTVALYWGSTVLPKEKLDVLHPC
jgi:hypothetical protein